MNRLKEASSMAGLVLVMNGVFGLIADWKNPIAWGNVFGGVAAILKPEGAAQ